MKPPSYKKDYSSKCLHELKRLRLVAIAAFISLQGYSQTDTSFWFAAPEIMNWVFSGDTMDRPIVLNITSYNQPATITISQPAGGGMPTLIRTLAANSTASVNLTNWIDNIECKPGDKVLNNGLKISSTAKVSIYYETNTNGFDPDLFALKGRNALGNDFWISSQYFLNNSAGSYSSFNIIATDNNTVVTIKPSNNIVGHTANTTFNIELNKGQTYAAIATSEAASAHLQGSHVTSNKPIAITLCDDELLGVPYGGCADMAGDQTVPVDVIGTEYIAVKGSLSSPYDKLYIMAVSNGTIVNKDGAYLTTLNAGDNFETTISNNSTYIQADKPVYAYQLSGIGCEAGSAILPKISCTGSSNISFIKTSVEELYITLVVKNGGQGNFSVNGSPGLISANQFFAVPGTFNNWYAAKIKLDFGKGSTIRVANATSLFHLGVLQGGVISGTGYGYFSDFAQVEAGAKSNDTTFCSGATLQLFTDSLPSISYTWSGPNGLNIPKPSATVSNLSPANSGSYILTATLPGCASTRDSLHVIVKNKPSSTINVSVCEGQSYLGHTASGTYNDTLIATNGCDSIRTLNLVINRKIFSTINASICEGQSYLGHTVAGTYNDTLIAANGCDSIRTLNLVVNRKSFSTINESVCEGQIYLGYTASGSYIDTLIAANGCDSIRTLNLVENRKSFSTINASVCERQSYLGHTAEGTYKDTLIAANGCDSIRTLNLVVNKKAYSTIDASVCEGQSYLGHTGAGTYTDTLFAANGCDSIRTLNLVVVPAAIKKDTAVCDGIRVWAGGAYQMMAGIYYDTAMVNSCRVITTTRLTLNQLPRPFLGPDVKICEGDAFALTPGSFNTYLWQNNYSTASITVSSAGTYWVKVTNDKNCVAADTIQLFIDTCLDIVIPNAFSPNNDGINDTWVIEGLNRYKDCSVEIYNRYGQLLFKSVGYPTPWNGVVNRQQIPFGTYYYLIEIPKLKKRYSGWVLVVR